MQCATQNSNLGSGFDRHVNGIPLFGRFTNVAIYGDYTFTATEDCFLILALNNAGVSSTPCTITSYVNGVEIGCYTCDTAQTSVVGECFVTATFMLKAGDTVELKYSNASCRMYITGSSVYHAIQ